MGKVLLWGFREIDFIFSLDFLSTYSSLGLRVRPWRPIFYSSFEYALSFSAWRPRVFLCSMFHLLRTHRLLGWRISARTWAIPHGVAGSSFQQGRSEEPLQEAY